MKWLSRIASKSRRAAVCALTAATVLCAFAPLPAAAAVAAETLPLHGFEYFTDTEWQQNPQVGAGDALSLSLAHEPGADGAPLLQVTPQYSAVSLQSVSGCVYPYPDLYGYDGLALYCSSLSSPGQPFTLTVTVGYWDGGALSWSASAAQGVAAGFAGFLSFPFSDFDALLDLTRVNYLAVTFSDISYQTSALLFGDISLLRDGGLAVDRLLTARDVLDSARASLSPDDYTADSWQLFCAAADDAQASTDAALAGNSQLEVNRCADAMDGLTSLLAPLTARQRLQTLCERAAAVDGSRYTQESFGALSAALDAAEAVLQDASAADDALDGAASVLSAALDTLAPAGPDSGSLADELNAALALSPSLYTRDSYAALAALIPQAQALLADGAAAQDDLDAMAARLRAAMDALVPALHTDELRAAIALAGTLNASDYTADSYAVLTDAALRAQALLSDPSATQGDIDQMTAQLQDAMTALVPVQPLDSAALVAALTLASQLNAADYTADSWAAMLSAKESAQDVMLDIHHTQQEMDDSAAALNDAIDALVRAAAPPVSSPKPPPTYSSSSSPKTNSSKTSSSKESSSKTGSSKASSAKTSSPWTSSPWRNSSGVSSSWTNSSRISSSWEGPPWVSSSKGSPPEASSSGASSSRGNSSNTRSSKTSSSRGSSSKTSSLGSRSPKGGSSRASARSSSSKSSSGSPAGQAPDALAALLDDSLRLRAGDYSAASWNALADAYNAAHGALLQWGSSSAKSAAESKLRGAVSQLQPRDDMEADELGRVLDAAATLDMGNATASTSAAFRAAGQNARAALSAGDPADINDRGRALLDAWGALQLCAFGPTVADWSGAQPSAFSGQNFSPSQLQLSSDAPLPNARALCLTFDVSAQQILTLTPPADAVRHPALLGYDGMQLLYNPAGAEGLETLYLQLTGDAGSYSMACEVDSRVKSGWQAADFSFAGARLPAAGTTFPQQFQSLTLGMCASVGTISFSTLRSYRLDLAHVPVLDGSTAPTAAVQRGGGLSFGPLSAQGGGSEAVPLLAGGLMLLCAGVVLFRVLLARRAGKKAVAPADTEVPADAPDAEESGETGAAGDAAEKTAENGEIFP